MISAFANSFKIPELRRRIVFTLMILVVVQIGAHIVGKFAHVFANNFLHGLFITRRTGRFQPRQRALAVSGRWTHSPAPAAR